MVEAEPKGRIFNVQRFSLHDGPGIRVTLFFQGCPLRCLWCHNPEGTLIPEGTPTPEGTPLGSRPLVVPERCIGDGECLPLCPEGALSLEGGRIRLDRGLCTLCGLCFPRCPTGALRPSCRTMTLAEAMAVILKERPFFSESGGGVTFSGGEPLAQPAFLRLLLQECRQEGISTAVDTCGEVPWETFESVLPRTDLFLFDLKALDEGLHRRLTGRSNGRILANLSALVRSGVPLRIRIPLVGGANADSEALEGFVRFLSGLSRRPPVDLLLYHTLGREKYPRLGLPLPPLFTQPSPETVSAFRDSLEREGFCTTLGG